MSLMESLSNSYFEQVGIKFPLKPDSLFLEIFLIDKIVEYVDYDKFNKKIVINPFKHNEQIDVRIRVFTLLATIFERSRKTLLSFLVIDVKYLQIYY